MINYSSSIKISQLNQLTGSGITMDDFLPIVDSGSMTTDRISLGDIKTVLFNTASIGNNKAVIFQSGSALTASNNLYFDYNFNILFVSSSIRTPSITSSLLGTSSYANSASFAATASMVLSANSTFANTSSYVTGSNGILKNLYLNVDGQQTSPFYYGTVDSGLYFVSTTANSASFAEIYLAPSGSSRGTSDYTNNVGIWINGGNSAFPLYSLPIYLGGNPQNSSPISSLTILSNGNVGIGTMQPVTTLHVNGIISSSAITSSLNGTSSWANNVISSAFATTSATSSFINYIGQNTGTSSYALTASFASGSGVSALSSSYSLSGSYALSGSYSLSSSYAQTASYVSNTKPSIAGCIWVGTMTNGSATNPTMTTLAGTLTLTASRTSTGFYQITHNIGNTNYFVTAVVNGTTINTIHVNRIALSANSFTISSSDDTSLNDATFSIQIWNY